MDTTITKNNDKMIKNKFGSSDFISYISTVIKS